MEYTKEYSTLVMNHSIARAEFQSMNQKDISEATDIRTETITRAKQGQAKLSPNQINRLVEMFGRPKNKEGMYVEAVVFDTLDLFIENHSLVHVERFNNELATWFCDERVKDALIKKLTPVMKEINYESEESYFLKPKEEVDINKSKKWLAHYIHDADFKEWYEEAKSSIAEFENPLAEKSHNREVQMPSLSSGPWKSLNTFGLLKTLYVLGYLIEKVLPNYCFSKDHEHKASKLKYAETPTILTGEIIESIDSSGLLSSMSLSKELLRHLVNIPTGRGFSKTEDMKVIGTDLVIKNYFSLEQMVEFAQVDLFLNSKMEYRFLITVTGNHMMNIVIKNVDPLRVLDEYNKLCGYFKLGQHKIFELKQSIAEKGGYIPGAEVL
jgi:hypothetical protein